MRILSLRYSVLAAITAAALVFSLNQANATGNADPLEKAFSAQVSEFYNYTDDSRAMIPIGIIDRDMNIYDPMAGGDAVILLHFWATWCPPCVKELPKLDQLAQDFAGQGLNIVPVSLDYGLNPADIEKFMKRNGADTLPPLRVAPKDPAWDSLRKFALPSTFLIHPDGRVLYKMVGDIDWTSDISAEFLKNLLAVTLN